jgi:acyl carrier protein
MTHDATQPNPGQLGLEGTMDVVRRVIAERFSIPATSDALPADEPLFSVGGGLSSLEGMELLSELEQQFGVRMNDPDWWARETPTLASVSQLIVDLAAQQAAPRPDQPTSARSSHRP